jgi:amino acid permease
MKLKHLLIIVGLIILGIVAASAIIPEKDCAGNNTWDKDKVCPATK